MNLKKKTTLYMSIAALVMVVALLFSSFVLFRHFSIISTQPGALSIAGVVRDYLTRAMKDGRVHEWGAELRELEYRIGIKNAHVHRAQGVIEQFGPGEIHAHDRSGQQRLAVETRKPVSDIYGYGKDARFVITVPYLATTSAEHNCLACHHVSEGSVLGTVTMEIPLAEQWRMILISVLVLTTVLLSIAITVILYIRRELTPFEVTALEIESAVDRAHKGDFSGKTTQSSDDEIGRIAEMINQLLALVHNEISSLSTKVAGLLHYEGALGSNLLLSMTELVESLVEVSRFKQSVEEDETRAEVYLRLAEVVSSRFNIDRFSLYEVDSDKNRMLPVSIDGEPSVECRWCDPEILVRASACRARRTGHIVDATDVPGLCPSFAPPHDGTTQLAHICIPVNQSGSIGNVLQLVVDREQAELTELFVPFIAHYLHEAAPVIESKRLMDALRDSSLRDPMTGLHNRRFLEEYTQNLVSYSQRNDSSFSILMADLDYFKQVNDTYGHEAGDTVLKELAKVLRGGVRASDLVIRYGGEEFLIILLDTGAEDADNVAEKLRASVEEMKVQLTGAQLQKTLSIGVASFPVDSDSFWQIVKYADVAMYRAKETGRNRVLHFAPEMWMDQADY